MNLVKAFRNIAVAALMLSAGVANAALYQFNLTGDYTASWQLNSTVTPDSATGGAFAIYSVAGTFSGSSYGFADLIFYDSNNSGGLGIFSSNNGYHLFDSGGPQLYSGSSSSPTFLLGVFNLINVSDTYTLTVTDLDATSPGTVPEPATAAMLIAGLCLLAASRKRFKA